MFFMKKSLISNTDFLTISYIQNEGKQLPSLFSIEIKNYFTTFFPLTI